MISGVHDDVGVTRKDVDYLVKVLNHDMTDLVNVDWNLQRCVADSCIQYLPESQVHQVPFSEIKYRIALVSPLV